MLVEDLIDGLVKHNNPKAEIKGILYTYLVDGKMISKVTSDILTGVCVEGKEDKTEKEVLLIVCDKETYEYKCKLIDEMRKQK